MTIWHVFTVGSPDTTRFSHRAPPRVSIEERAHNAITAAGYQSLFAHAIVETRERHPKRNATRLIASRREPLLPGYALVRNPDPDTAPLLDMSIRRLTTTSHRGTHHVVRSTLGIIASGAGALDHLLAISGDKAQAPAAKRIRPGSLAYVTSGPFTQAEPVIIEAVDKHGGRVTIGQLIVRIPLRQLEAA